MPKVNKLHFDCYPWKDCPANFRKRVMDAYEQQCDDDWSNVDKCPILTKPCSKQRVPHLFIFELVKGHKLKQVRQGYGLTHFNFLTWCNREHKQEICDDEKLVDRDGGEILHPSHMKCHRRCIHNIAGVDLAAAPRPSAVLGSAIVWAGHEAAQKTVVYGPKTWPMYYWFCYWVHMALEGAYLRSGNAFWRQLWDYFRNDYAIVLTRWRTFTETWIRERTWHTLIRDLATETVGVEILRRLVYIFVHRMKRAANLEQNPIHWDQNIREITRHLEIAADFKKNLGQLIDEFNTGLKNATPRLKPLVAKSRPKAFDLPHIFLQYRHSLNSEAMDKWKVPLVTWAVWAQSELYPVVRKIGQERIHTVLQKIEEVTDHGELKKNIESSEFDAIARDRRVSCGDVEELKKVFLQVLDAVKLC